MLGSIRERDGATTTLGSNLEGMSPDDWTDWFADPANLDFSVVDGFAIIDAGETLADVSDDFCENLRDDGLPDIGAVEYDGDVACITTEPWCPEDAGTVTDTGTEPSPADSGTTPTDSETTPTDDVTTPTDDVTTPTVGSDSSVDGEGDDKGGCGCQSTGSATGYALVVLLLGCRRRRGSNAA